MATPKHEKTTDKAATVIKLSSLNQSQDTIAAAIGTTKKTLMKHYEAEVRAGKMLLHKKTEDVFEVWYELATKHKQVSAVLAWMKMVGKQYEEQAPKQEEAVEKAITKVQVEILQPGEVPSEAPQIGSEDEFDEDYTH